MKIIFTSMLFIVFSIGLARYLEDRNPEKMKIEKEMKTELARYEIEKIKAQTDLYYAILKYKRG